jgi:hypothetical protein
VQRLQRRDSCCHLAGLPTLRLFKIALVLVRFDHVASFIVNANDGVMWTTKRCVERQVVTVNLIGLPVSG